MKKRIALILAMVMIAGFVAACAADDPGGAGDAAAGGDGWEIVVVPKDATNPWFVRMESGVNEFAAANTQHNIYQRGTPEIDATLQAQLIQELIAMGVDAICVVPVDPGALEPVLRDAREAGIVVITHEGASLVNVDYNIEAFSNEQYGQFIMDNLAEAMGEEGVFTTMVAHVTNASHNEWADAGVRHAQATFPNMTLLEAMPRVESEDNGDVAFLVAMELFQAYPELRGIMGTSSFDAPGIARAIEELGLTGQRFTSGTGMPADNAALLRSGAVQSLTLWDPALAGQAMVALAIKVLEGVEVVNGIDLGVEGFTNMQFQAGSTTVLEGQGWIVINAENVDSFGF